MIGEEVGMGGSLTFSTFGQICCFGSRRGNKMHQSRWKFARCNTL